MIEPTETNTENYLAYGSIVSLMLDYNSSNTFSTISYDPKGGNIKTTDKEDEQYEIIAVFLGRVYYKTEKNVFRYYYFIDANTKEEFEEYVNNSKSAALYETGKTAEYGDKLMTLSTCSYHTEDRKVSSSC